MKKLIKKVFNKVWHRPQILMIMLVFPNLIMANVLNNNNPGFESSISLQYWKEIGTASSISRSSAHSHSGSYACRFANPTTSFGARGVRSTNISTLVITPNSNYRIGAWCYVTNEGTGSPGNSKIRIIAYWFDSSTNQISSVTNIYTNVSFNVWHYHYFVAKAPSTANYIEVEINGRETVNNDNDIFIDDVEVWQVGKEIGEYIPGTRNGWQLNLNSAFLLDHMPPGYCKKVTTPETNYEFKIVKGNWGAANEWSAGYWINSYDHVWNIPRNDQGSLANAIWKNLDKEFVTVVTITNLNGTTESFGFMKTSAFPTFITFVSNVPGKISHNTSVTISMHLAYPKCAEEYVFIRWTTNNWASSTFSLATGSGTNYTAVIPAMPPNKTVEYYGMTSTSNAPSHSEADLLTLAFKNSDGGTNFKYTATNTAPYVTNLIQPPDEVLNYYSRRPKFVWSPAIDADNDSILNYHIWISTNSDFSTSVVSVDTGSTNSWWQCDVMLDVGKTYYWRVTAYDGIDWGPYSPTNTFVINPPFITVDGDPSDWGNLPSFPYGDNTCTISNGIWVWKDTNGDVRTDPPNYGNAELLEFRITADTNVLFFLARVNGMSDPPLTFISITIDTNADGSNNGLLWISGLSESYINQNARWEYQFEIAGVTKTGLYEPDGSYITTGESWLAPPASPPAPSYVEAGIPWSELGIKPPCKLRFTVSLGVNNQGVMHEIGGSDVCDVITTVGGNTYNEVSDGTNHHYFDVNFNNVPYSDTHGGHTGLVVPDHLSISSSRSSTKAGISFWMTNKAHSWNDGCKACVGDGGGSLVRDYNGPIQHTITPNEGDLLKTKSSGFQMGKMSENVILNQIGSSIKITVKDSNYTVCTGSTTISCSRPDIHINEVNMMPIGPDDNKEWIEIYSKEPEQLNLTNWYFTDEDGGGYHITQNVLINSNNFLVLYDGTGTDDTDFSDNRGALYGDWGSAILTPTDDTSVSGDEASLYCSYLNLNKSTIIDFVGWDGNGVPTTWADYANATNAGIWTNGKVVLTSDANIDEGNTIGLLPDGDDNNSPSDWVSRAFPTPGYPNNLHPLIQEVANDPKGNTYAEYIELFNPCPYDVDISKWAICDPTASARNPRCFPYGTTIKSNGFILIGRNANNFYSVFKFYPDFEWDTTGGDNPSVPNLLLSYSISIQNNDTFFLAMSNYTTADVSVDEIVTGVGDGGTNYFPEGVWRGNNAPALNTSKALRRIPEGNEGTEDDDNVSPDSDISAENNEDLSTIFKLTNWDPNADDVYYVSWNYGSDARTPFEARHINTPWKTIQHAHDNMIPGDTTLVLPGTNYENVLITTSGSSASNITYSGYSNNSYVNGSSYGIKIQGADNIIIKKLNVISSTNGIFISGLSENNLLFSNKIFSNTNGIKLSNVTNISVTNIIKNNSIYNNLSKGFDINNATYFSIFSNQVYENVTNQIFISGSKSSNIEVYNNTIYNNSDTGDKIVLSGVKNSVKIYNNTIYGGNFKAGIKLSFTKNATISHNTIYSNWYGIFMEYSTNNVCGTNTIYQNAKDGIYLLNSSISNTIISNTVYSNGISSGVGVGGIGIYLLGPNVRYNDVLFNHLFNNDLAGNNDNLKIEAPYNDVYNNWVHSSTNGKGIILITSNCYSNNVYNNTLYSNNYAMWIQFCKMNNITGNTLYGNKINSYAVYMGSATNNYFSQNYFYTNFGNAIQIDGNSISNKIWTNTFKKIDQRGIQVLGDKNSIKGNKIYRVGWQGIDVEYSAEKNIIRDNIIGTNGGGNTIWHAGILVVSGAYSNQIINNQIFSNHPYGISIIDSGGGAAKNNTIQSNLCYNNDMYGIRVHGATNNFIYDNTVYNNQYGIYVESGSSKNIVKGNVAKKCSFDGIYVGGSPNNRIINNYTLTNTSNNGITFDNSANNNYCASNISAYNAFGIRINNTSGVTLYRNAVYHNNGHGIWLTGGNNCVLHHNSVASNDQFGNYDNLRIDSASTGNEVINNIFAYAKLATGYGIYIESGGSATLKFNDVYSNVSANYGGVASPGNGSISNAPQWLSYNIYSTNFLYLTNTSPCIDTGTNLGYSYSGSAPDMGWKEHLRPYVHLTVSKSVSNIMLAGGYSDAVPGSAISYKITYSIVTNLVSGSNLIISDKLPSYVTYLTDYPGTASGWSVEYSTNINPDQSYNSPDYTSTKPAKDKIRWVRWKKATSGAESDKTLFLKVIIK